MARLCRTTQDIVRTGFYSRGEGETFEGLEENCYVI